MQSAKLLIDNDNTALDARNLKGPVRTPAAADILTASEDEVARLLEAFRAISSMQQRMRALDIVERIASESTPLAPPMVPDEPHDPALDLLRRQQALSQGNQ